MRHAQQISIVKILFLSTFLSLSPLSAFGENVTLKFEDIYDRDGNLSEVISETDKQWVTIEGFMAPVLKAGVKFFVLTKKPLEVCPFCEPDAEWPPDILPVFTKRVVTEVPNWRRIEVTGLMSNEPHIDQGTSFYSKFRLLKSSFTPIK